MTAVRLFAPACALAAWTLSVAAGVDLAIVRICGFVLIAFALAGHFREERIRARR